MVPSILFFVCFFVNQVGRGVTVRADIKVPFGTVAVTRGGDLRGSVFAREFLLEEGERRRHERVARLFFTMVHTVQYIFFQPFHFLS